MENNSQNDYSSSEEKDILDRIDEIQHFKSSVIDRNLEQIKKLDDHKQKMADNNNSRNLLRYTPEFLRLLFNYIASYTAWRDHCEELLKELDTDEYDQEYIENLLFSNVEEYRAEFLKGLRNTLAHNRALRMSVMTAYSFEADEDGKSTHFALEINEKLHNSWYSEDKWLNKVEEDNPYGDSIDITRQIEKLHEGITETSNDFTEEMWNFWDENYKKSSF